MLNRPSHRQKLTGRYLNEMTMRYSHLAPDNVKMAVNKLEEQFK